MLPVLLWWLGVQLLGLAARREGKRVRLAQVVRHVRRVSRDFEMVVVAGAGGLINE